MRTYNLSGVIIARRDFFEADRIITIFSEEKGKTTFVSRGVKKTSSKMAGSVELFSYGIYGLAKGKNLDVLTSAESRKHFGEGFTLEKLAPFFLITEALNNLLPLDFPQSKVFKETLSGLQELERNDNKFLVFELAFKVGVLLGYALPLNSCSNCNQSLRGEVTYIENFSSGEVKCAKCKRGLHFEVSPDLGKLLRFIENHDIEEYKKIQFDEDLGNQLKSLTLTFLNSICQKRLKTEKFFPV